MQEPSQQDNEVTTSPPVTKKNGTAVLFIATIAMVLALVSLAFQFFFWELHKKAKETLLADNQRINTAVLNNVNQISKEVGKQQQLINEILNEHQAENRKKALLLAYEAEHLLTLAQYNMQFDVNINFAKKLMADADEKLQLANDPLLNDIRVNLIKDLTQLNSTSPVDVTALIARISAIADQVSASLKHLPVMAPATEAKPAQKRALTWKEKLLATLNSLRGIVTIRRMPEPVQPLGTPEHQLYIVEAIRLKLTEAEWAVLHKNPVLYQRSLEQAKQQLQSYYLQNPDAANIIQMIGELQQVNLVPPLPDLSNTITALRTYIVNVETSVARATNQPGTTDEKATTPSSTGSPQQQNVEKPEAPTIAPNRSEKINPPTKINPMPKALPT